MNKTYKDIIYPPDFVKQFKTHKEFNEWLDIGTKKDLECTLKVFEQHELYEHCSLIQKKISKFVTI